VPAIQHNPRHLHAEDGPPITQRTSGLDVISALKQQRPDARAIILTGYGTIATAVNAVKVGAHKYLIKPVDVDDVISALLAPKGGQADAPEHPMSADHVRWHHISKFIKLAAATCRRPRAASTCIGERCSGF
jgi:ActR/RegA family two-component response regulator